MTRGSDYVIGIKTTATGAGHMTRGRRDYVVGIEKAAAGAGHMT